MVNSHWQDDPHQQILEKPKWWYLTRPLHFGVAFGVLVVTMLIGWYFWAPSALKEEDIPVIRTEPGPIRIKPDSPGAPEIPHQDKMIYDELTSKKDRSDETSLRGGPEDPIEIEQPEFSQQEPVDEFPIANTAPISGDKLEGVEEGPQSRLQVVIAPNEEEKKKPLELSVPKIDQNDEKKHHQLRSLPLRKLFAMNTPSPQKTAPPRKGKKPSGKTSKATTAKKKPFPILPIPKSMLYAKRKPARQQGRHRA